MQLLQSDNVDVQLEWDLFQKVLQESLRTAVDSVRALEGMEQETLEQCDRMLLQRGVKGRMACFRREYLKGGVRQEINLHLEHSQTASLLVGSHV